ncbi:hypothetical protein [Bacillus sp. SM2101]|uniref:hypothetical protein n=1 Tax=Bacillus sp. SM2101 TaxID=2805366 RepID=UPI001BDE9470|nr:hypothetical protein [Bacillus sp. SM2101]
MDFDSEHYILDMEGVLLYQDLKNDWMFHNDKYEVVELSHSLEGILKKGAGWNTNYLSVQSGSNHKIRTSDSFSFREFTLDFSRIYYGENDDFRNYFDGYIKNYTQLRVQ